MKIIGRINFSLCLILVGFVLSGCSKNKEEAASKTPELYNEPVYEAVVYKSDINNTPMSFSFAIILDCEAESISITDCDANIEKDEFSYSVYTSPYEYEGYYIYTGSISVPRAVINGYGGEIDISKVLLVINDAETWYDFGTIKILEQYKEESSIVYFNSLMSSQSDLSDISLDYTVNVDASVKLKKVVLTTGQKVSISALQQRKVYQYGDEIQCFLEVDGALDTVSYCFDQCIVFEVDGEEVFYYPQIPVNTQPSVAAISIIDNILLSNEEN